MRIALSYLDDEGEEVSAKFPARHAVCGDCEGHGCVLNPTMRAHAYTGEEFEEAFHDEEDRAQYLTHGGIYDVLCSTCRGKRVVPAVDESRLSAEQRYRYALCLAYASELELWRADDRRTARMERGERW